MLFEQLDSKRKRKFINQQSFDRHPDMAILQHQKKLAMPEISSFKSLNIDSGGHWLHFGSIFHPRAQEGLLAFDWLWD